ncbi:hypothetical protein LTS18_008350 [Coniosporium uncinatum]|uniref:Uncharacterized protein n=1 Tax=Coniosporium uncinatum TaxID=93489 RepID=A0ACC3DN52_9PEZI|nr:hypothetical protein LTS18_008350 [Coniosporium uncinatum]
MQTSQAVDVIGGGVKVNALPERTSAIINHRINIGEAPKDAAKHVEHFARMVAEKYNLTLHAYDDVKESPSSISLSMADTTLDVAPVTPTNVDEETAYMILSGTTRALYGEDLVVTPAIMTGNTDTRYYWALTKNIFRFGPGYDPEDEGGLGNIHTVDEHISVVNHINSVKWFSLFVRNMDEANIERM